MIDGQQRLTTLQILLDAVQLVTQEHGSEDDAETLMELVANNAKRFRGTSNLVRAAKTASHKIATGR
jgi:uncharacterized protein with ParB-like and HNH nuclease domain